MAPILVAYEHIMQNGFSHSTVESDLKFLNKLNLEVKCTNTELSYYRALKKWNEGKLSDAANILEQILIINPEEILSLRLLHDIYYLLGDRYNLLNSVNRVACHYSNSVYGYEILLSLQSFGLQENHYFNTAEEMAMSSLTIDSENMVGYLSLAHLKYNSANIREGQRIYREFEDYWSKSSKINESLYINFKNMCEYGQTPQAMNIYEGLEVEKPTLNNLICKTASLFYLDLDHDATSDKWKEYSEPKWNSLLCQWEEYKSQRNYPFYDVLLSIVLCKTKNFDILKKLKSDINEYCNNNDNNKPNEFKNDECKVIKYSSSNSSFIYNENIIDYIPRMKNVGLALINSIELYYQKKYKECLYQILLPLKSKLEYLGMCELDRDLFNYFIIECSMRNGDYNLAHCLLCERSYLKPTSPYSIDRIGDIYLINKDYAKAKYYHTRANDLGRRQGMISSYYQEYTGKYDEW